MPRDNIGYSEPVSTVVTVGLRYMAACISAVIVCPAMDRFELFSAKRRGAYNFESFLVRVARYVGPINISEATTGHDTPLHVAI
jgi:hypothetical protein